MSGCTGHVVHDELTICPVHDRPHLRPSYTGNAHTASFDDENTTMKRNKFDRIRQAKMLACPCLLCTWALNPPKTFEEHASRQRLVRSVNASGGKYLTQGHVELDEQG